MEKIREVEGVFPERTGMDRNEAEEFCGRSVSEQEASEVTKGCHMIYYFTFHYNSCSSILRCLLTLICFSGSPDRRPLQ